MPLPPRIHAGDAELGKKDDDHKPAKTPLGRLWRIRPHGPQRRNLRRIALGALALIALYYFFKNMPTDLENPRQRPSYDHTSSQFTPTPARAPSGSQVMKSGLGEGAESELHYYNGPIKFYQLATTLHAVSKTKGSELVNRNVVSLGTPIDASLLTAP